MGGKDLAADGGVDGVRMTGYEFIDIKQCSNSIT